MTATALQLRKPSVIAAGLLFVATCLISIILIQSDADFDPLKPFRSSLELVIPGDSAALRPTPATFSASDIASSSSLYTSSTSPTTASSSLSTSISIPRPSSGDPSTPSSSIIWSNSSSSISASNSSLTASLTSQQTNQPVLNLTNVVQPVDDNTFDPGDEFYQIYSLSSSNRTFYPVSWDNKLAYNLNVLPHPSQPGQYVILAQAAGLRGTYILKELTCIAEIQNDILTCITPAVFLEPTPSISCVKCVDGESPPLLNVVSGPRDARMFYGPEHAYIMYGSQSQYTWLGLWIQDAGQLIPTLDQGKSNASATFPNITEIQRPPPVTLGFQKNYFVFWDVQGNMYAHHDISPNRTFAQLSTNGSVGPDLSPQSLATDEVCMAKHMPRPEPQLEGIHQSTNSLAITRCRRADADCSPSEENTSIINIFQHKTYHYYHAVYYSYVMLFQQAAPFAVQGISKRPLWIHGRDMLTNKTHAAYYDEHPSSLPPNHTEMFYITSISWKSPGQRYHGYIDDPMFVSFGIEDTRSGTIDINAGDLLEDLAYCENDDDEE